MERIVISYAFRYLSYGHALIHKKLFGYSHSVITNVFGRCGVFHLIEYFGKIRRRKTEIFSYGIEGMMGGTQKTKVWIYKGITLKSSTESDFGTMEQVCSKFEENAAIQASMFTLPEGVEPQEMDMNMFGGGF